MIGYSSELIKKVKLILSRMYFLIILVKLEFEVKVYVQPILFVVAVVVHVDADVVDVTGVSDVVVDDILVGSIVVDAIIVAVVRVGVDVVIAYAISQIWSKVLDSKLQEYFNFQVIVFQKRTLTCHKSC